MLSFIFLDKKKNKNFFDNKKAENSSNIKYYLFYLGVLGYV